MLSAFQLENNRLTRLEADEIKHLASSVWVDLVEPDDDERSRVQTELGQNLATRPELEDIEASARFFEDEDGLHIHSFFFFEDAENCLEENFDIIGKRDIVDIFQLHVTALRVADIAPARCLPKAHGSGSD